MKGFTGLLIFVLVMQTGTGMGQANAQNKSEIATLGAGCFWCVEAIFDRLDGVISVESGYAGGTVEHPTYQQVCTGLTGHAEVVHIRYDPDVVSFEDLLLVFFRTHDPTTLNRQGADVGTQYRSAIFFHDPEQRRVAQSLIERLNREEIWTDRIVTSLEEFHEFYPAEAYHQEYFENNPNQGYCRVVIQPKVEKFEALFKDRLK
ncbi:MAG: peptide-methionine (S)-S-oxide reductase MsrA [Bacteroidales bacterium]